MAGGDALVVGRGGDGCWRLLVLVVGGCWFGGCVKGCSQPILLLFISVFFK